MDQTTENRRVGGPRFLDADARNGLLLNYEFHWVDTFRGLRDGNPEIETETFAGGRMFIKRSGPGPEEIYVVKAGEKPRKIRQPKFSTTPDETRRWRSRVREEEEKFEENGVATRTIRVDAIPSERRLWEALLRAKTGSQVRRIYSQSRIWLKPRKEFPDGGYAEYWPFRRVLYRDAEQFCRAKLDPRYPGCDQRDSGDHRRIEYLARVMAGLTVRLAPSTGVEILRKLKHLDQCSCWRCMLKIAPRHPRSLASLLASGEWFRQWKGIDTIDQVMRDAPVR